MIFNSLAFLIFFPLVCFAFYLCPPRFRWFVLLVASCYFYMAFVPSYILILFFLILTDYVLAQRIEASTGRAKRLFFLGSIIANVGILFVFKYFNFFNENIALLAKTIHWNYSIQNLKLILPLGLSFHTFQSLSYIIEVYRGKQKPERHLGIYALYVLFFPQLVAGPIERPQHLLPQFRKVTVLDRERFFSSLQLMAWGFFKKVVVADRVAIAVDYVYKNLHTVPWTSVVVAVFLFAFQLYADFSGYSDIAVGAARMIGFDLTKNFQRPYFSKSIAEFWRRWHISLSNWFRDYLYYPLAYSAKRTTRWWLYLSLFVTFLVSGLWHGAGWTFVMMGALHGTYLVVGMMTKGFRDRFYQRSGSFLSSLRPAIQTAITFVLVSLSWIFFRSPNFSDARLVLNKFFLGWFHGPSWQEIAALGPYASFGFSWNDLGLSVAAIALLLAIEIVQEKMPVGSWVAHRSLFLRSMIYSGFVLGIIIFGVFTSKQFIYFQF